MNLIKKHLDKNNLHHAYLIEGVAVEVLPEILGFFEELGVKTAGNPDFYNISIDSFKIKDAQYLKSLTAEKSFSEKKDSKKIFIISVNNFLLEAQNTLLKIFEEPTPDTHFFLIIPDKDALLKTVASRFYFISAKPEQSGELKEAEKFIAMPLAGRITYLKELLNVPEEDEDDEEHEIIPQNSARSKASSFLNAIELALHNKMSAPHPSPLLGKGEGVLAFDQIFKVREFLRQPGSSVKSLMESVAIVIPNI
jgi:hypothetical protein